MFALRLLEDWRQRVIETFTPNTDDRPTYAELLDAFCNAVSVQLGLDACTRAFNLYSIPFTEGLELVEEVERALREDHGGVRPRDVLSFWLDQRGRWVRDHRTFATPEEKTAMVAIYERWKDKDRINEQFWGLMMDEPDHGGVRGFHFTHERAWKATRCLSDWLEKRKAGQVY
ncbi:hypothetical protein AJ78_07343 [Emergomyces pasteurianus Ep9510]|uniref:Uncharacterized protein n=1 Tax=Emergomyces pasteurianus Ep9510 TaxID=1447872 RepID=A0A1J9P7B3_9EURO|nr:hypothetical protein AJ78_07343 [Emergomyces pasteurianus Ep9510]